MLNGEHYDSVGRVDVTMEAVQLMVGPEPDHEYIVTEVLLVELAIKLKYVVLEYKNKELQDEVGGHRLVLSGLQGLLHGLVLPLYVGVEGRHIDGDPL